MVVRWEEGRVILEAWLKLDFLDGSVDSVGLWMLWMGIVVDPLRVLWCILGPMVY